MKISAKRTLLAAALLGFGLTALTLGWVGPLKERRTSARLAVDVAPVTDAADPRTEDELRRVEELRRLGREDEARALARELTRRGVRDPRLDALVPR